jgi:hypothetical protein
MLTYFAVVVDEFAYHDIFWGHLGRSPPVNDRDDPIVQEYVRNNLSDSQFF